LFVEVLVGALSYSAGLLLLWRASGAPDTPEKDVLAAIVRLYRAPPQPAPRPSWLREPPLKDTIVLYVPISQQSEYAPLRRSQLGKLKAVLLRMRDRARWTVLRSNDFDFYSWCTNIYTNRGDIAIREAISRLVAGRFGAEKRYVELDWGSLDEEVLRWVNANAAMFVICGGGYVSADAASGKLSRAMNDVSCLSRMTCPVVAFGIGYNSLLEYQPESRITKLPADTLSKISELSHAACLMGVRDRNLEQLLLASRSDVDLIGDPALFLERAGNPEMQRATGSIRVGINFALHGPGSAAIFRAHFDTYVAFLRKVSRNCKAEFFYFVHCDTEMIAISLLRRAGIKLTIIDKPPAELAAGYAQMDIAISQMLHSSILATNAGVASISIGYDQKNMSFYEMMGMPDACLPHDGVTEDGLWMLFQRALERRNVTVPHIAQRKAELWQLTEAFLEKMAAVLPANNVSQPDSLDPQVNLSADGDARKLQDL
jgi:polysaccharide pyruvyl transferase WcaK-like protein